MKISPTISLTTILLYLIMLFLASIRPTFSTLAASPTPVSPVEVTHLDESEIEQAIYSVIEGERRLIPAYLLFDTLVERITISEDGLWATAWLVPLDPQTGRIIPTEPGLVILQKTEDIWQAFLPSHPDWVSYFAYLPPELLSFDVQTTWLIMSTVQGCVYPPRYLHGLQASLGRWKDTGYDPERCSRQIYRERNCPLFLRFCYCRHRPDV